jgi:carbamoyltransferase
MGSALLIAHRNKIKIKPYKNLYLGIKPIYPNNIISNTNEKEIASLIANNNLVGIFQGRQEAGPRALGNRSLLFNPCNPHGKDIINSFKGREWYRPLGGTVLYEHKDNFFNLNGKKQIPYMSYATKVKNKNIPAITHVDGSCRVQTLKLEQNVNFYKLIKEFYNLTSIPVIGNTSLNIAGNPIVGTYEQALYLFKNTPLMIIQHIMHFANDGSFRFIYDPKTKNLVKKINPNFMLLNKSYLFPGPISK